MLTKNGNQPRPQERRLPPMVNAFTSLLCLRINIMHTPERPAGAVGIPGAAGTLDRVR
jgi:hypothetical protein